MTKRRKMGTGRVAAKTRRPTPREARALRSGAEKKKIALLRRELSEALEQQTATSEVLGVISRSPGELGPVFQTMLANATRLCGAKFANFFLYEEDSFRIAAHHNAPPAYTERGRRTPSLRVHANALAAPL